MKYRLMTYCKINKLQILAIFAMYFFIMTSVCIGQSNSDIEVNCDNMEIMNFRKAVIFIPHFDDEVLGFCGVIYKAIQNKKEIKVVFVTDGAAYVEACYLWKNGSPPGSSECLECDKSDFELFGKERMKESMNALKLLGVDQSQVEILGYPDGGLKLMYDSSQKVISTNRLKKTTYNGKLATGNNLLQDIKSILLKNKDAFIFTTHMADHHSDHSTLASFIQKARKELIDEDLYYNTYWTIIHEPNVNNDNSWPLPICDWESCNYANNREKRYNPELTLDPPTGFSENALYFWMDSVLWKSTVKTKPLMRMAIDLYKSQLGSIVKNGDDMVADYNNWTDYNGYLISFVKRNHLYWKAQDPK